jgi:hypothetical protein
VCSDAAQCENRGNSDLVARLDVRGYSSIHGLVNLNIALIIGVVKEDNGNAEDCRRSVLRWRRSLLP